MLRHDWLAHGPVISLRLNSNTSSSLSINDQQSPIDYEKSNVRTTITPTSSKPTEKSTSPTNSLVELELHTSSFFDTARLREHNPATNREQQRRNRASAIADTSRYYSSNNSKTNSTRPVNRRPLSLTLENQYITNPVDYHYASTSETGSQAAARLLSPSSAHTRRSRRTVSPTSNKSNATYPNHERLSSPPSSYRYQMKTPPDITRRTTSPTNPSRYVVSYDVDPATRDLKRKPVYKYTHVTSTAASDLNAVPSLSNSATPVAPSVFTTSAIKFAPPPTRFMSSLKDQDNSSSTNPTRFLNPNQSNPSSNLEDTKLDMTNRRSLLTSADIPSTSTANLRKSRLLDDNNNFIALKVHDP